MTIKNPPLTGEVVPVSNNSGVFTDSTDRFAIKYLGDGKLDYTPGEGTVNEMYGQLRANVYIDQTGFLPESSRNVDGTEWDEDDERSSHFALLERGPHGDALFACARLILKQTGTALPVEEFYPEIFADTPAPVGSVEVSRFISKHASFRYNMTATTRLLAAMTNYVHQNNLGPTFAVVEDDFSTYLSRKGVAVTALGAPKWLAEYNTENFAARIDTRASAVRFGEQTMQSTVLTTNKPIAYWS